MTKEESDNAVFAVGEKLLWTVEHGDLEDLRNIFAENAVIWHAADNRTTSVEQTIKNLRKIKADATEFRYVNVKRQRITNGYVQQHELYVKTKDGREIHDRCCTLHSIEGGRIAHVESYHDSGATSGMAHRNTTSQ
jgi:ketosteroid isomerase-like protein